MKIYSKIKNIFILPSVSFARKSIYILVKAVRNVKYWKISTFSIKNNLKNNFVGVTYANDKHTDGAGAQLQRIYGIYSISRFLNLPYIHSPLTEIGYQGLVALENNSGDRNVVSEYNKIFDIPSDINLPNNHTVYEVKDASLDVFRQLKKEAAKGKTFVLARILYPYGITDIYPKAYQVVKDISPFPFRRSSVIRIAIHVRRGELFAVGSYRMLPNSYYISVAWSIHRVLDSLNLDHMFELHTEVPTKVFTVTPTSHGILNRISNDVIIGPKFNKLKDFDLIPNLKKFINCNPISTLERMATANILIMSHSSFSYAASILNVKGVIIYHPFQHRPLNNWLITDDSGNFSKNKFLRLLKDSFVF